MMKQKKIIVPILTLAVMLLMVGGVYAVFSSTQPEKSKAENVRDTTDQDYEKGLTEEQKAFNELINKVDSRAKGYIINQVKFFFREIIEPTKSEFLYK